MPDTHQKGQFAKQALERWRSKRPPQDSGRLFTDQPIPVIHAKSVGNRRIVCDFEGHGDTCDNCHITCPNDPLPEE